MNDAVGDATVFVTDHDAALYGAPRYARTRETGFSPGPGFVAIPSSFLSARGAAQVSPVRKRWVSKNQNA